MLTFIDLFAGIGGFRISFENLGAKCVFSSEIDKFARQTYAANFGETPHGDITLPETKAAIPKQFDILCGGFPCQAFSIAGKRKGFDDTRGTLFFEIADILKNHQPKAFLLENVKGLLNHDKGRTFTVIVETLRELGYYVPNPRVLNSMHFGVPQNRERVFFVGFRNDLGITKFKYPKPLNKLVCFGDIRESNISSKYTLTKDKFEYFKSYKTKHKAKGNGFGYKLITDKQIVPCLTTRYRSFSNECLVESDESYLPRILTVRECARLQGYPDTFKIVCSDAQSGKQFGNSVTVPVVQAIGKQIVDILTTHQV